MHIYKFGRILQSPFRGISPSLAAKLAAHASRHPNDSFRSKQEHTCDTAPFTGGQPAHPMNAGFALSDSRWCIGDGKFCNRPIGEGTAWQEFFQMVNRHDARLCQHMREEIDSLMIFAGLFSGVLTAFIIESYKWLLQQPDDLTADYMRQLLAFMSKTAIAAVQPTVARPSLPDGIVSLINGLWFSSLSLSLTSALLGIVSKQWLREYLRDTDRSPETNLAVRQVKFEGLMHWCVGAIVTAIPLLLQGALFLFLIGIVYLLWHIQPVVAALISAFGLLIVLFFFITTVLPAAQFICYRLGLLRLHLTHQVPFKSAQAWLFLRISFAIINFVAWLWHVLRLLSGSQKNTQFVAPYRTYSGWPQWDLDWTRLRDESARWNHEPTSIGRCLGFIELNFEHRHLREWIWNCLWSMRESADDAKYLLQCVRRTPQVKSEFPASQDGLAQALLPLLHSSVVPQATLELVSMALLESHGDVRLEHLIRAYNGLVLCGVRHVPEIVYRSLQETISMSKRCSKETRMQLYLIAQGILKDDTHTESGFEITLDFVADIIAHISASEMQEEFPFELEDLSLDFCEDIMHWLRRYPTPTSDTRWRDYAARVMWSAGMAVILAQRLSGYKSIEDISPSDPRLASVRNLVQLVDGKSQLIPRGTFPTWLSGWPDTEAFERIKESLEAISELSSDSADIELPLGAKIHFSPPSPLVQQRPAPAASFTAPDKPSTSAKCDDLGHTEVQQQKTIRESNTAIKVSHNDVQEDATALPGSTSPSCLPSSPSASSSSPVVLQTTNTGGARLSDPAPHRTSSSMSPSGRILKTEESASTARSSCPDSTPPESHMSHEVFEARPSAVDSCAGESGAVTTARSARRTPLVDPGLSSASVEGTSADTGGWLDGEVRGDDITVTLAVEEEGPGEADTPLRMPGPSIPAAVHAATPLAYAVSLPERFVPSPYPAVPSPAPVVPAPAIVAPSSASAIMPPAQTPPVTSSFTSTGHAMRVSRRSPIFSSPVAASPAFQSPVAVASPSATSAIPSAQLFHNSAPCGARPPSGAVTMGRADDDDVTDDEDSETDGSEDAKERDGTSESEDSGGRGRNGLNDFGDRGSGGKAPFPPARSTPGSRKVEASRSRRRARLR